MKNLTAILAWLVALSATTASAGWGVDRAWDSSPDGWVRDHPRPEGGPIPTSTSTSSSVAGSAPTPPPVPPPVPPQDDEAGSGMTIAVTNSYGVALQISFGANEGAPTPTDATPTQLDVGGSGSWVFPTGWAGRIYVGKQNYDGNSLIEGSFMEGAMPDIDVSYVDGYSVPVVCSSGGAPVTGCNIDLWTLGNTCDNVVGDQDACLNSAGTNGPPLPFFAPCAGAAYTFPNDNGADDGGASTSVSCCVGTSCPTPAKQASRRKRDLPQLGPRDLLPPSTTTLSTVSASAPTAAIDKSHLALHRGLVKRHAHHFIS